MKIGIVTFPGSSGDLDAARAVRLAGGRVVPLWHGDESLHRVDAVVLPGGFSYGDHLRCGAIARFSPVIREVIRLAGPPTRTSPGLPVLGIGNGFQILCESQLLPGALLTNGHGRFVCRDQRVRIESTSTAWTCEYAPGEIVVVPVRSGGGRFVADDATLAALEAEGRVVVRYVEGNPNGSARDIAGITNATGTVVGLMPHPENAVEPGLGPDRDGAGRFDGTDGLRFFTSVLEGVRTA